MFRIHEKLDKNKLSNYIAEVKSGNSTKYLSYDKTQNRNEIKTDGDFIPCFNFEDKREIIYITGKSGSGKSYLCNQMAEQYHKLYPKRPIFYITKVKYEKGDPSLNMDLYIMVDLNKFLNLIRANQAPKEDFTDSLIIFDDLASVKGDDEKTLWYFIDLCLEVYRKNNTSFIMCNHQSSEYKKTRLLLMEMTKFVCFNNLKTRSDRVLLHYIEMTKQEVSDMMKHNSRWFCIDTNKSIVLTEHSAYKLG